MASYPLVLTVEHEDGEWAGGDREPQFGYAVIKLGSYVVRKIALPHPAYPGDREALEQYAAEWLASLPGAAPAHAG